MKDKIKTIIWIVVAIAIIVLIGIVGYGYFKKATMEVKNPILTMEVEGFGTVKMELYPDQAPQNVANIVNLANRGFYNGTKFHRIVKDFMIQAGTKDGDGKTGAKLSDLKDGGEDKEYGIKGEFVSNGVNNTLKFEEGTVGVARADYTQYSSDLKEESYNSGNSQFFIMTKANTGLNGLYTPVGKVIEGMDVVHKIEEVEVKAADDSSDNSSKSSSTSEVSTPVNPPVVTSITVDTQGVNYDLPQTLSAFDYMSWFYQNYKFGQ